MWRGLVSTVCAGLAAVAAAGSQTLADAASRQLLPGDRVEIRCAQDSALHVDRTVASEGSIVLPNLGRVNVAGLTFAGAAAKIAGLLEETRGWTAPRVEIAGLYSPDAWVSVSGVVDHPFSRRLKSEVRLGDLLARAAPAAAADTGRIQVSAYDGRLFVVDAAANPGFRVRPGDRIFVPPASRSSDIVVVGGVWRPGVVAWRPGLTLLDVVALAGGLSPHGRPDAIVVVHDGAERTLSLDRDGGTALQRGDQVKVTPVDHPLFVSVAGVVARPGLTPFREGMTLTEVVQAAGGLKPAIPADMVVVYTKDGGRRVVRRYHWGQVGNGGPDPVLHSDDSVDVYPLGYKGRT